MHTSVYQKNFHHHTCQSNKRKAHVIYCSHIISLILTKNIQLCFIITIQPKTDGELLATPCTLPAQGLLPSSVFQWPSFLQSRHVLNINHLELLSLIACLHSMSISDKRSSIACSSSCISLFESVLRGDQSRTPEHIAVMPPTFNWPVQVGNEPIWSYDRLKF